MTSNAETAFEAFKALEGKDEGVGDWFEVTQERIDQFAEATIDHQFIHVDPERAATESPFGTTIAHGFLSLSMLTHLSSSVAQDLPPLEGLLMGINYGFDKVRFLTPVPAGGKIRAQSTMSAAVLKANNVDITRTITVELEGSDKPALVADWITRIVFA